MNDTMDGIVRDAAARSYPAPPMSARTRLGLGVLGASVGLGLLGDALLRATPWGLNVLLWVGTLVGAVLGLLAWQQREARGDGRWLALPLLFFAGAMAWRASAALAALNLLALLVALALAAARTRAGSLRLAGLGEYAWAGVVAGVNAMLGILILLLNTIEWHSLPRTRWSGLALAVGRGLALALPLLFLFGGLFMAADAVFETLVVDLFDVDVEEIVGHLFLFGFWTWLTAGFLRQTLLDGPDAALAGVERPVFARLGMVEVGIVLGALNALFGAFVLVQFRYFFGGAALVQSSTGLTYAEYARRGFFELVTVAALLLPLLLAVHWLLRPERPAHVRAFRLLAGALVALLFVVMLSALQRMRLYTNAFGLTELRLYTTAFMGWLAVVFGWFAATVLRGQRERFAFGALVTAFVALALLHALNPDAFIVRTNVARQGAPQPFDSRYVTTLSADAVPALVAALPQMAEPHRCQVAAQLLRQWTPPEQSDWRTWNWGRWRAWRTVGAHLGTLQTAACPDDTRS